MQRIFLHVKQPPPDLPAWFCHISSALMEALLIRFRLLRLFFLGDSWRDAGCSTLEAGGACAGVGGAVATKQTGGTNSQVSLSTHACHVKQRACRLPALCVVVCVLAGWWGWCFSSPSMLRTRWLLCGCPAGWSSPWPPSRVPRCCCLGPRWSPPVLSWACSCFLSPLERGRSYWGNWEISNWGNWVSRCDSSSMMCVLLSSGINWLPPLPRCLVRLRAGRPRVGVWLDQLCPGSAPSTSCTRWFCFSSSCRCSSSLEWPLTLGCQGVCLWGGGFAGVVWGATGGAALWQWHSTWSTIGMTAFS